MNRRRDAGVVLVNVLVLLGLASTVVYLMLSLGDLSIARSQRFGEAGQALTLVRAGEQSAIAALRRDMIEAPETDHAAEPWAQVTQAAIEVQGGAFELELADAQGLFNLNTLAGATLGGLEALRAIVAALKLPPETAERIVASLLLDGPLDELGDLTWRAGIPPEEIASLKRLVTVLPGKAPVNINAAPVELIEALLKNPVQARVLASIRSRADFLTPDDVARARLILPPEVGFRSDLFRLRVRVRSGDTVQSFESLLQRRIAPNRSEVVVIRRQNAMAAVSPPPPSPEAVRILRSSSDPS